VEDWRINWQSGHGAGEEWAMALEAGESEGEEEEADGEEANGGAG
jgi:hypothetical protein